MPSQLHLLEFYSKQQYIFSKLLGHLQLDDTTGLHTEVIADKWPEWTTIVLRYPNIDDQVILQTGPLSYLKYLHW